MGSPRHMDCDAARQQSQLNELEDKAMNGGNNNGLPTPELMKALNRLLAHFRYSLASYLRYASPWIHPANARLHEAIRQITADHRAHVQQIVWLILERRGTIELGQFPTRFTAYNYLALDYLAQQLVEHERELIERIARTVAGLGDDADARQLGEDILALERQHLKTLTKLV